MSQQALARKYRPQTFADLVGQEPIVKTLQNAIEATRIHHAYIFTGTRGVGKTSAARIFAKALNCKEGPTTTPCNTCSNCLEIAGGNSVDVFEIDAASHTKVEETRELMGRVAYSPASGKYRIFIIDEVHMLSKSSFNALLKTLEEPPAHAVFILATTEPQKILDTVRSRCIEFAFRRITPGKIAENLRSVLTQEEITFQDDAVERIAIEADGSMRDALSLTDQVAGYAEGGLTRESVEAALGLTSKDVVAKIWCGIFARDASAVHQALQASYRSGADLRRLGVDLAEYLRRTIVHRSTEQPGEGLLAEVLEASGPWSLSDLHRMFDRLHQALMDVERSPVPDIVMETALLRLAVLEPLGNLEDLLAGGGGGGSVVAPPRPAVPESKAPSPKAAAAPQPAPVSSTPPENTKMAGADLLDAVAAKHPSLAAALHKFGRVDGDVLRIELPETELVLRSLLDQDTAALTATFQEKGPARGRVEIDWKEQAVAAAEAPAAHGEGGGSNKRDLLEDARLRGLIQAFPGAEVVDVRRVQ